MGTMGAVGAAVKMLKKLPVVQEGDSRPSTAPSKHGSLDKMRQSESAPDLHNQPASPRHYSGGDKMSPRMRRSASPDGKRRTTQKQPSRTTSSKNSFIAQYSGDLEGSLEGSSSEHDYDDGSKKHAVFASQVTQIAGTHSTPLRKSDVARKTEVKKRLLQRQMTPFEEDVDTHLVSFRDAPKDADKYMSGQSNLSLDSVSTLSSDDKPRSRPRITTRKSDKLQSLRKSQKSDKKKSVMYTDTAKKSLSRFGAQQETGGARREGATQQGGSGGLMRKSRMASAAENNRKSRKAGFAGDADAEISWAEKPETPNPLSVIRHRNIGRKWKKKATDRASKEGEEGDSSKVQIFGRIWLFSRCSPKFLHALAEGLIRVRFDPFEEFASAGDSASDLDFCIIEEGTVVRLLEDGTDVERSLEPGQHFGAWNLVGFDTDLPVTYAAGPQGAVVGVLSRNLLESLLNEYPDDDVAIAQSVEMLQQTGELLRRSQVFAQLSPALLFNISERIQPVRFARGEALVSKGQVPQAFYLLDGGTVAAEIDLHVGAHAGEQHSPKVARRKEKTKPVVVAKLSAGTLIADHAVVKANIPSSLTFRAQSQCVALMLSPETLASESVCFPDDLEWMAEVAVEMEKTHTLLDGNLVVHLSEIPIFSKCSDRFLNIIQDCSERRVVIPETVMARGIGEGLFAIQTGTVSHQVCGIHLHDMQEGAFFAQLALLGCTLRTSEVLRSETTAGYIVFQKTLLEEILGAFPQFRVSLEQSLGIEPDKLQLTDVEAQDSLGKLNLFRECNPSTLPTFFSGLLLYLVMPGGVIFGDVFSGEQQVGDDNEFQKDRDGMVVLLRGMATTPGNQLIHEGSVFGEGMLFGIPHPKMEPVIALSACVVATMKRPVFELLNDKIPTHQKSFEAAAIEMFDKMSVKAGASIYKWPLFTGCVSRFLYILDLHVVRRVYLDKSVILDTNDTDYSADRVSQSTLFLAFGAAHAFLTTEEYGTFLDKELQVGDVFGELTLLGIPYPSGLQLYAHGACDVQMLSNRAFRLACAEFPAEKARYKTSLAERVVSGTGQVSFGLDALRSCALFREASSMLLEEFCEVLEPIFFLEGEMIIQQGDTGDCMYVLCTGVASLEVDAAHVRDYHAGAIFGEVALLDMGLTRRATIRAVQPCVAQALHRADFHRILEDHPNDRRCFEALRELGQESRGIKCLQQVRQQILFKESEPNFVTRICEVLECRVYFPDEVVFAEGETGPFALYLLVTGECHVSVGGSKVSKVLAGETFGETATLGLSSVRTATVKGAESVSGEQCYCFVLHDGVLNKLLEDFPDERAKLEQIAAEKNGLAASAHKRRDAFLQEVEDALPKCGSVPLFGGHSQDFLTAVANGAEEILVEAGKVIVEACTDDATLFVVLEGEVDIEVGCARCARLGRYAAIGELAVLGVFTKQMATIRAATWGRIIRLPAEALVTAASDDRFESDRTRLAALRERLNRQGGEGLQRIRCLRGCQELCRQVLALQAIPLGLEQGASWIPKPIEHGEVFILALRGRSMLALPGVTGAPVTLKPGDSVPDALLRRFGASLCALDSCELCLLPRHMLLAAVMHFPEARSWFDVLRSEQNTIMRTLEERLRMHLAETAARLDHPRDEGISQWVQKRHDAVSRARAAHKPCFGVGPAVVQG